MNDEEIIENLDLLLNMEVISEAGDMEVIQQLDDLSAQEEEEKGS